MQKLWFGEPTLDVLLHLGKNTMVEHCGIQFATIGDDFVEATMPHEPKNLQPYGFMHGGANCVLAETLGSIASAMVIDNSKYNCVGIEINASHLRSVRHGFVTGKCMPVRIGKTVHVWQIDITDSQGKLTCVSRLTVAIVPK